MRLRWVWTVPFLTLTAASRAQNLPMPGTPSDSLVAARVFDYASLSVTHNPNGTTSIQNSVTGPSGKTVTDNLTRTPTTNGFTTTGTYTNAQGQNGTVNRVGTQTTNPDGSVTDAVNTTITTPGGEVKQRDSSVTINPAPPKP